MRRAVLGVLANVWVFGCGGATGTEFGDAPPDASAGASGQSQAGAGGAPGVAGKPSFAGSGAIGAFGGVAGKSSGGSGNVGNAGATAGMGGTSEGGTGAFGAFAGTAGDGGFSGSTQGGRVGSAGSGGVGAIGATAGNGGVGANGATAGSGGVAGHDPSCPGSLPVPNPYLPTRPALPAPMCKDGVQCDYDALSSCLCLITASPYCTQIDYEACKLESLDSAGFAPPADPIPAGGTSSGAPVPQTLRCKCTAGSWLCR